MIEVLLLMILALVGVLTFYVATGLEVKLDKVIQQNEEVLQLLKTQIESERIVRERMRR